MKYKENRKKSQSNKLGWSFDVGLRLGEVFLCCNLFINSLPVFNFDYNKCTCFCIKQVNNSVIAQP